MRFITDREQIASYFRTHAIIKIDMENHIDGYSTLFEGEKVQVLVPTKNHGTLEVVGKMMYNAEDKKFFVLSGGTLLSGTFGYDEVMELCEKNHAPTVSNDLEVGILEVYPHRRECRIRVGTVKNCNTMYYHACEFTDVE